MMNTESVKARLKNLAIKEGGIFLYALFDKQFARATMDIDLLAQRIPNDVNKMKEVFQDIFSIEYDDALRYDLNSLAVHSITEFKEYHGVNVSINSYLDKTKISVSIDIGFGDVVYPDRMQIEFPVFLDMDKPRIFAYSLYSVIAEKFEAFTSLGLVNGRYKDFYDIYILARKFDLSGLELQEAIQETFLHRGTSFNDIVAFEKTFVDDVTRQNRWQSFVKKKKAIENIGFEDAITLVKTLLMPIVNAIQSDKKFDKKFDKKWLCKEEIWKK